MTAAPKPLLAAWEKDFAGRELNGPSALSELLESPSNALMSDLGDLPEHYRYEVLDSGVDEDQGPSVIVWTGAAADTDQGADVQWLRSCGQLSVGAPGGRLLWEAVACPETSPEVAPADALPNPPSPSELLSWPTPPAGVPKLGCAPEDLNAVIDGFGAAMGAVTARLVLQNVSEVECTLTSTPALQLREGGLSRVIALPGTSAKERTLGPGQLATAWLAWRSAQRNDSERQHIDARLPGHASFHVPLGTGSGVAPFTVDKEAVMEVSPFSVPHDALQDLDAAGPHAIVAPTCVRDQLSASMQVEAPSHITYGPYPPTTAIVTLTNDWLLACRVSGRVVLDAPGAATPLVETSSAGEAIIFPTRSVGLPLSWNQNSPPPPEQPWNLLVLGATLDLALEGDPAVGLVGAEVTTGRWG